MLLFAVDRATAVAQYAIASIQTRIAVERVITAAAGKSVTASFTKQTFIAASTVQPIIAVTPAPDAIGAFCANHVFNPETVDDTRAGSPVLGIVAGRTYLG